MMLIFFSETYGLYEAQVAQCCGIATDRDKAVRECLANCCTAALLHCFGGEVFADILLDDWEVVA